MTCENFFRHMFFLLRNLKTKLIVARTIFSVLSVSRTFDHHTHMLVAQDMLGMCCTSARLESGRLLDVLDPNQMYLHVKDHFAKRRNREILQGENC